MPLWKDISKHFNADAIAYMKKNYRRQLLNAILFDDVVELIQEMVLDLDSLQIDEDAYKKVIEDLSKDIENLNIGLKESRILKIDNVNRDGFIYIPKDNIYTQYVIQNGKPIKL